MHVNAHARTPARPPACTRLRAHTRMHMHTQTHAQPHAHTDAPASAHARAHTCRRYTTSRRVCVCVCKIGPISARTLSFRHQTSRKFFHIATFPSPTFGPLFAFHCPLFFTKNNNLECRDVLKTVTATCVCVCIIWPISGPISARTLSFRHQTSRKNFSHIYCPLFFTKNNNSESRDVLKMVTVTTQDRPLNCKQQQPLTSVVQSYSARLRS